MIIPCTIVNANCPIKTDCTVTEAGPSIVLTGYDKMIFSPKEATALAVVLNRIATDITWRLK